jgi:cobalt-zinc-cadmium efflux system outer membrane protein
MSRYLPIFAGLISLAASSAAADLGAPPSPPRGVIALRDALAAALLGNPELSAVADGIRIEDAHVLQAGVLPNPELRANVDNFAGGGANRGFDASESALRLTQLVELGGKRARRRDLAGLERDAARWDYEARRASVLATTAKAFIAVLALQERVALATKEVSLAEESAGAVDAQVRAGSGSPAEALRARVAISQSDLVRMTRERELAAARIALAAAWGSATPTFERTAGRLDQIAPPPPLAPLLDGAAANPDLARWTTELAARDAAVALEEARAVPDVVIGAGPSYYADAGGAGMVVDFSVPLPVFNRNQGNIDAARAARSQADAARRAADTDVRAAVARAHAAVSDSYERAVRLQRDMLPGAEDAYARTREAYAAGAVRALDVLDARRTVFGLRDQRLEALAGYHEAMVDLDRLAGVPIDSERTGGQEP